MYDVTRLPNFHVYIASAMHALNLRPNQGLFVRCGRILEPMAQVIAEEVRRKGGEVLLSVYDPHADADLIRKGDLDEISRCRDGDAPNWDWAIRTGAATMSLFGPEYPLLRGELAKECPEASKVMGQAESESIARYLKEIVNTNQSQWLVFAAPTPGWALQLRPDLGEDEAVEALWRARLTMVYATRDIEACISDNEMRDRRLHTLADQLNALGIQTLSAKGEGNDFTVDLHPLYRFQGGSKTAKNGQRFDANRPSEEVFVTPMASTARGVLRARVPFLAGPVVVKDLVVTYGDNGEIVDMSAGDGYEHFKAYIASDDDDQGKMNRASRRLGEFALVGRDSVVAKAKAELKPVDGVMMCVLDDENELNHCANGNGYATCIRGGDDMSEEELQALDVNVPASIHSDFMWGGMGITVTAKCSDGREVVLQEDGLWTEEFAAK